MTSETARSDGEQSSRAKVFISYSRKDMAFADRLEAALNARGFEPLIDRTEIYAFEDWWKRIEDLIARADTVAFVLSPDSVTSEVAQKEVAFAAALNKRFAPIVLRPVSNDAVPAPLAKLNFVFFDDEARVEANADRLAEALATDIAWIRQHTDFGERARQWVLAKSPSGLLLRSPVLEQAERWIAGRPRGAPEPTEETQAFIRASRQGATRRRNILSSSLAAGLVVALALAGLAYWQRGVAVAERDKATRNFSLARQTAESLVFDIAQGLREVQGMSAESIRAILETSRKTFEQLSESAPDDPALQRARAAMLVEFGNTYLTLGDLETALKTYRDSLAIAQLLAASDESDTERQLDVSISYERIGGALESQGKLDEALQAFRDALAIRQRLGATDRSNTRWQYELARAYLRVGGVLEVQGKLGEALQAYRSGLAIDEALVAANPVNCDAQRNRSVSYDKIGDVRQAQGNLDDALEAFRASLAIRESLVDYHVDNSWRQRDFSVAYNKVGSVLEAKEQLDAALEAYRKGL